MSLLIILSATAVTLARVSVKIRATDTNDEAAEAVTSPCGEQAYAKGLRKHLANKATEARQQLASLRQRGKDWATAALAETSAEQRCNYRALSAKAQSLEEQATATANQISATVGDVLQHLDAQIGILDALLTTGKLTLQEDANKHSTTGQASVNIKLKPIASSTPVCAAVSDATKLRQPEAPPEYNKLLKLKVTAPNQLLNNFNEPTISIGGFQSCNSNSGSNLNIGAALQSCTQQSAGTSTLTFTQSRPGPAYTATTVALRHDNKHNGKCQNEEQATSNRPDHSKKLAYLVCKALDQSQAPVPSVNELSGTTLKTDPIVKLTLRNCLPQFQHIADTTDSEQSKPIEEYIEKTFHKNSKDFNTNFVEVLNKDSHTSLSEKTSAQKSITGISNAQ
uniref:Variant surface glycoprotein 1463 n=1 Tax=Trypanosoma brucei TaxID=5691 RepID=M4T083_9TRYP|nr:variant surface glycoprotein 1463 [Trypanosoma brucei]